MSAKNKPTVFLTCLYGCALGLERPQQLNHENFPSHQSAKIEFLEISHYTVLLIVYFYMYVHLHYSMLLTPYIKDSLKWPYKCGVLISGVVCNSIHVHVHVNLYPAGAIDIFVSEKSYNKQTNVNNNNSSRSCRCFNVTYF